MARLTPPKSPIVYDKHHSGCMWSLYSLFEFRQGNSSRKLLSDRKRFKRDVADDGNVKQHDLVTKLNEQRQGNVDRKENSLGPDMPNEKKLESKETKSMHSGSELDRLPKNHGKASKTYQRPSHSPLQGQTDSERQKQRPRPDLVGKSLDKLESAVSSDASRKKKHAKKRRGCGCKNVDFVKYDHLLKVNDVAEAIVNQKLIEGKYLSRDGVNQQSKQLLDALEILNANKDLFTKLLQDPNSLLVKHIQDLRESQEQKQRANSSSEPETSECQSLNDRRHDQLASSQELGSSDKFQSKRRSDDPQPSEIVVLKPGPISAQNSLGKMDLSFKEHVQSGRPTYFSFGDIKKKFRHAMGVTRKDQNLMLIDGVGHRSPIENRGAEEERRKFWNAVHGDNKDMEKSSFDIQRREKIEKLREFKARIGQETATSSGSGHRRSESRMYMENFRRHYSAMITNKNEDNNFFQKQTPSKLLQRTISSPEYDFLPLHSPGRDIETGFVASQMRFSPYSYSQVSYDSWRLTREQKASYASSLKQNIGDLIYSKKAYGQLQVADTKPYILDNLSSHTTMLEADLNIGGETNPMELCSNIDDIEKNDTAETSDARDSEEAISSVKISSAETSDVLFLEETNVWEAHQSDDMKCSDEETEKFECSRLDSAVKDQPSTSSSDVLLPTPSSIQRVDDCDSSKDIGESSPISVLEQFFTDVASSPITTCQPEEEQSSTVLVKSRLDPETNTNTPFVYGTISEYVKTVVQACSLNLDDLILKYRGSDQLLEAVTLQANQFCGDCNLLFDCLREVLVDVHDAHFRISPWLSFIKSKNLQSLQAENFVTQEAMKRIDCYFKPESSQRSLEQLIEVDLKRSGAWQDTQTDAEDVISEIAEGALEELIMETIVGLRI